MKARSTVPLLLQHSLSTLRASKPPAISTVVSVQLEIEAITCNAEGCEHQVVDEPDGSLSMHNIDFPDGSNTYFEIDSEGVLTTLTSSSYIEVRNGVLLIEALKVKKGEPKKSQRQVDKRRETVAYPQPGVDM